MLIGFYRDTLVTINQWFETTCTIIDPIRSPVRVRINEPDRLHLLSARQRRILNLKHNR